jgi:class 3 adenylate cyclase
MAELPGGTVTFLFTDIAGSAALWERAPAAMLIAMARHDDLFDKAIIQSGGINVRPRGEGDRRFAVFNSAPAAMAAAFDGPARAIRCAEAI